MQYLKNKFENLSVSFGRSISNITIPSNTIKSTIPSNPIRSIIPSISNIIIPSNPIKSSRSYQLFDFGSMCPYVLHSGRVQVVGASSCDRLYGVARGFVENDKMRNDIIRMAMSKLHLAPEEKKETEHAIQNNEFWIELNTENAMLDRSLSPHERYLNSKQFWDTDHIITREVPISPNSQPPIESISCNISIYIPK